MTAKPVACPTASGAVLTLAGSTGYSTVMGWSIYESGGAATCRVELRVGSATGRIIAEIPLAISGHETVWMGDKGVICNDTVLYAVVTGTGVPTGSIWVE